jgi:hypothetical protein
MSVAAQILIGAQTTGFTSSSFSRSASDGPCTLVAGGLATTETATIQIQDASGNWQNVPSVIAAQMTATAQATTLNAPGVYRVVKTATAAAVGVALYSI